MVKGTNLLPSLNLVLQVLKQQSPPLSGETDKKLCQDILEKEWKARKKFLLDNFSEAVPMLSHELDGWPPMAGPGTGFFAWPKWRSTYLHSCLGLFWLS